MQIKTIRYRLDNVESFDEAVNAALSDGWILKKRYISDPQRNPNGYRMLVAEMVKDEAVHVGKPFIVDVALDMTEAEDQIREFLNNPEHEEIRIKYFVEDLEPITATDKGDWIDLRAAERVEMKSGEYRLIRLGVGMILPDGYEAQVAPRSSAFKNFGIVLANSLGIIDNSYSGDADEWHFPAVALRDTIIEKGDRICQFRIVKNQPRIDFVRVAHLNDESRGGIGSTGKA